jgi:hypothetical protein
LAAAAAATARESLDSVAAAAGGGGATTAGQLQLAASAAVALLATLRREGPGYRLRVQALLVDFAHAARLLCTWLAGATKATCASAGVPEGGAAAAASLC